MTLSDDFKEAVGAAGGPENRGVGADGSWTTVVLTRDQRFVPVKARLASSGEYFTLEATLAELRHTQGELLAALLRLNEDADRIDGAACALHSEEFGDFVLVTYHWILPAISPEQFTGILKVFARSVRNLHSELEDMSKAGAPIRLIESAQ